jgi:hypothetical protein
MGQTSNSRNYTDSKNVWQNRKQKITLKYYADIQQLHLSYRDYKYSLVQISFHPFLL